MARQWTEEQKQAARERERIRRESAQEAGPATAENEQHIPPQLIEPGGVIVDPPEDEPVEVVYDANDPYQVFLSSLDADTRDLLSDAELRGMWSASVAEAEKAKQEARRKSAKDDALYKAKVHAGLIPKAAADAAMLAQRNRELVPFTVDLPPSGENGEVPDIGLRIDQRILLHGHTYMLPRAQADSYREMLYRAGEMELTFQGANRRRRQWMMGRAQGGVNTHIPLNEDGSMA